MRLEDLQPGDILAYRVNSDLFAIGIAVGQFLSGENPDYVHIGIWAGDGVEIAAYGGGVQAGGKFSWPCDVYRPQFGSIDDRDIALAWLWSMVGKTPYAWWGLLWVWLLKLVRIQKLVDWADIQVFCSWLAVRFLNKAKLNPFPNQYPAEIMPADFDEAAGGLVFLGSLTL